MNHFGVYRFLPPPPLQLGLPQLMEIGAVRSRWISNAMTLAILTSRWRRWAVMLLYLEVAINPVGVFHPMQATLILNTCGLGLRSGRYVESRPSHGRSLKY
jgi:hypothetical protein